MAMLACARLGRDAFGGVRRVLGVRAAGPHRGRRGQAGDHHRRAVPARQRGVAEGRRRRGGRRASQVGRARSGGAPHRHRRRRGPRAATCGGTTPSTTASTEHTPEAFDSEHPLFLLYTSGTTGKPKGIMHTSGGYLTQASYTHYNVFDVKPETDVYWCTADIGWVTGHTYIVYGPLSNGVTQVVYEGTPASPDEHRHFEVIEKYGVTIYYTAPTLIRTFMKWGREIAVRTTTCPACGCSARSASRSTRRRGAGTGMVFGGDATPIVDTWWQTETGAAMISPLPGVTDCKPGSAMRPLPGHLGQDRRRRRQRTASPAPTTASTSPAIWCSTSRGRRCCAASGATPSGSRRPTGRGSPSRAGTSPATARATTPTARSGCSAASTT